MKHTSIPDEAKALKEVIRDTSKSMLKVQSRMDDITIREIETDLEILSHWMVIILVSSSEVKLTFKSHFKSKAAKMLATSIFKKKSSELSEEQALDFMREYCNLTAGNLKRYLLNCKINAGVSLPIATRGFDELYFNSKIRPDLWKDYWALHFAQGKIICSVSVEMLKKVDFSNVENMAVQKSDEFGDSEFL